MKQVKCRCGHTVDIHSEDVYAVDKADRSGEFWGDLCERCFQNAAVSEYEEGNHHSDWFFASQDEQEKYETASDITQEDPHQPREEFALKCHIYHEAEKGERTEQEVSEAVSALLEAHGYQLAIYETDRQDVEA